MRNRFKVTPAFALAVLSALALSACGGNEGSELPKEGLWIDVGPVAYQVQISRQLNPSDQEDIPYLEGLPQSERKLAPNETYFAIFLRAQNSSDKPQPTADQFEIEDTQGEIYRPLQFGKTNVFAYRPMTTPADGVLPLPDSAAASGPTAGAVLVFKVAMSSFQDRPLDLRIRSGKDKGAVELDV